MLRSDLVHVMVAQVIAVVTGVDDVGVVKLAHGLKLQHCRGEEDTRRRKKQASGSAAQAS